MDWSDAMTGWLAWLGGAAGLSVQSIRLRRHQLRRLAQDLGGRPGTVTGDALVTWLAARVWSRETRRSHIAAFRSFFGWALAAGAVEQDPTVGLPKLRPIEGVPRPAAEDVLLRAQTRADDRVRLMIDLAARHGLRRGEIAVVAGNDVMASPGGWSLLVHGKGGKDRVVPLLNGTAAALRSAGEGWTFPNGLGSHLTPGHVGVLISRVLPPGVTPHMLRHRFATVVYRKTLDIRNLQRLLGHASVATTQRYAAPDDAVLRAVAAAAA